MPKLIYNKTKGLKQQSGSGFQVDGVSIKPGITAAATYTGASYEITCVADSSDSLDGTYFIIYDKDGNSYAFWIDTDNDGTAEPAGAAAADNSYEITAISTDASASDVGDEVVSAIDTNAGTYFEAINDSGTVSVYVLKVGPMSDTTEDAGDSGFTISLTDSSTRSAIDDEPMVQATVTAGTDVATVLTEIALDDGATAGQEKFLQVAAPSAGQIVLTGNFVNGTTTGTKLTFDSTTGAPNGLYMIWVGASWWVVNMMSTQTIS